MFVMFLGNSSKKFIDYLLWGIAKRSDKHLVQKFCYIGAAKEAFNAKDYENFNQLASGYISDQTFFKRFSYIVKIGLSPCKKNCFIYFSENL